MPEEELTIRLIRVGGKLYCNVFKGTKNITLSVKEVTLVLDKGKVLSTSAKTS